MSDHGKVGTLSTHGWPVDCREGCALQTEVIAHDRTRVTSRTASHDNLDGTSSVSAL